jgi:hypothetical protein
MVGLLARRLLKPAFAVLTAALIGLGTDARAAFTVTISTDVPSGPVVITDLTAGLPLGGPTTPNDQTASAGTIRIGNLAGTQRYSIVTSVDGIAFSIFGTFISSTNTFASIQSSFTIVATATRAIPILQTNPTFTITVSDTSVAFPTSALPSSLTNSLTVDNSSITAGTATTTSDYTGSPANVNNPTPNTAVAFSRTSSTFGLSQTIVVSGLTIGASGEAISIESEARLETLPTPLPATALAALIGLPILGIGRVLRRRQTTVA